MAKEVLLFLYFLLPRITIGSKFDGLTIKLTQRDSPKSSLYQPNLFQSKRTENLILQSIARATYLVGHDQYHDSNATNYFNSTALRPKVDYQKNLRIHGPSGNRHIKGIHIQFKCHFLLPTLRHR